jgi:hypothetical protein
LKHAFAERRQRCRRRVEAARPRPRARAITDPDGRFAYNAQVAALRWRLREAGVHRVGTVDKSWGQEAAVVVYSCTSSLPEDAPRGMEFLYDPHRFNVATSRARGVVIVVASPRLFAAECRTPEQMRIVNGLCRYTELAGVVPPWRLYVRADARLANRSAGGWHDRQDDRYATSGMRTSIRLFRFRTRSSSWTPR